MNIGLEVIVEPEDPSDVLEGEDFATGLSPADNLTDVRQEYEIKRLDRKLRQLDSKLTQEVDRHTLRKRYSVALFCLVVAWVCTVWVFIALQGLGAVPRFSHWKFSLSNTVLVAYITSTTASILGLFGIAAYWLFGQPKEDKRISKPESKSKVKSKKQDADED